MAKKNCNNLELGFSTKKQIFTINGDTKLTIELDPTDFGVISRTAKYARELDEIERKWREIMASPTPVENDNQKEAVNDVDAMISVMDECTSTLQKLEIKIRKILDEIFDTNVSDVLLGNSSAFSPINGKLKYEHIIDCLFKVYEEAVGKEAPKFNADKVKSITQKYKV